MACVESTLLDNAVTWTTTNSLTKKLDGCYTRLLRYCLEYHWSDHVSNIEVYGKLAKVSKRLLERKLRTVNELRINLSVNYYCGAIQILLGVNAVKERAQDLIMLRDFLVNHALV